MSRLASRSRVAVLVATGAWLVHQLRYALVFGGDASAHVDAHAHQYLDLVGPALAWAAAAALATWVLSLGRPDVEASRGGRLRAVWLRASLALVLIYGLQETVEGLLAPGHPNVLLGVFGHGGWIALPLAIVVGGAVALLLRGARAARQAVSRAPQLRVGVAWPALRLALPAAVDRVRSSHVLARKLAGRAPPRTI